MTGTGRRRDDAAPGASGALSSSGRVIVVVDDSPVVLRMLTVMLEDQGFEVAGASDGDEALARIREISPALVLIDANMPRRDGFEVCQELRADPRLVRQPYVIMLTAGGQAADRERAERMGVDEFMTKPFSPSHLRDRVTDVLGDGEMTVARRHISP